MIPLWSLIGWNNKEPNKLKKGVHHCDARLFSLI